MGCPVVKGAVTGRPEEAWSHTHTHEMQHEQVHPLTHTHRHECKKDMESRGFTHTHRLTPQGDTHS